MLDILEYKEHLLNLVDKHKKKKELSTTIDPFTYDPGNTENLEYYFGEYNNETSIITLNTEIKGLRYEDRSRHLDEINEGDIVIIKRDPNNPFNTNNFEVFTENDKSLGSLSAELCNQLAPLFDLGYAIIIESKAQHIEKLEKRSRYVKQGILFIRLIIKLIGI